MKTKLTLIQLLTSATRKKILFLGREGIFTQEEIVRFLKKYNFSVTYDYEDDIAAVIEHHSLNPIEEDISCLAYDKNIPIFKLLDFEKLLSESINDNELLMSIKLSNDQSRIFRLLGNTYLNNTLFVKLLGMYQWHEEDDNVEDRDVVMYTLRRYIDIKPNEEDLLYSSLTLKRLAREATDPRLLEVLIQFPNMSFLQKGKQKITLRESIATNKHIDKRVIGKLIRLRDNGVEMYLAANTTTPIDILHQFIEKNNEDINQALASNPNIDEILFTELLGKSHDVIQMLLCYQPISVQRYEQLSQYIHNQTLFSYLGENEYIVKEVLNVLVSLPNTELLIRLACNKSFDAIFLESIFQRKIPETYQYLAINPSSSLQILETLYYEYKEDKDILIGLSYNTSTPVFILEELYQRDDFEITKGIASNASVPLEILNILKIDTRLRNELTSNKTFVESITQKLGLQS